MLGRDRELDRLRRRVDEQRLVTVTGTGGIGQTTLAGQIAAEEPLPDGSRRCELARLDASEASLDGLAGLLDLPSFEALLTGFADGRLLLLLDDCEHVLAVAAEAAARIARDCPHVHVLTTSRGPLGVPGQQRSAEPTARVPRRELHLVVLLLPRRGVLLRMPGGESRESA